MADPLLSLIDACAGFPGAQVLHGVSLKLEPGARLGLHGANGSGKTTLLRCLVGLHALDSGSLQLSGKTISSAADVENCGKKWASFCKTPRTCCFAQHSR